MKKVLGFIAMLAVGAGVGYTGAKLFLGDSKPESVPVLPDNFGVYLLLLLPVMYLLARSMDQSRVPIIRQWVSDWKDAATTTA